MGKHFTSIPEYSGGAKKAQRVRVHAQLRLLLGLCTCGEAVEVFV